MNIEERLNQLEQRMDLFQKKFDLLNTCYKTVAEQQRLNNEIIDSHNETIKKAGKVINSNVEAIELVRKEVLDVLTTFQQEVTKFKNQQS